MKISQYILIVATSPDDLRFWGPFPTDDEALTWGATMKILPGSTWWVSAVREPV